MDLTDDNETVASLFARSISQKTRAKKSLGSSNGDYSESLRMGDEDIMVFPDKLLKLKSEMDDAICKTGNDKVLNLSKEVQPSVRGFFPTFVKIMGHSHVAGPFWLTLPKNFAKLHLPKKDTTLILEDDGGKEYDVKYLSAHSALSAGWRGFSIAHKLSKGYKLVFQLVKELKFKVHIVRLDDLNEVHEALEDFMVSQKKADMHCGDLEEEIIEVQARNDKLKNSASNTMNNQDYLDSLMMEDEDIMVLPHKLRKLKSKISESKADKEILKAVNVDNLRQTKEVQPSASIFTKIMVHSNVAGDFLLHLPNNFCDSHLPKEDVIMIVEDDNGVEYYVKYLGAKATLSGGWKAFSMAHKLSKGDKLVFQLIKPLKFKVHIMRSDDLNEDDGASNLVMSNLSFEEVKSAKDIKVSQRKVDKHYEDLEVEIVEDRSQKGELRSSAFNIDHVEKINHNTSSTLLDASNGVRLRKSTSTNFENVHIIELDNSNEADGASTLVMSNSFFEEVKSARDLKVSKRKADKHCEDLEVQIIENNKLKKSASHIDHARKIDDNTSFRLPDISDGVHLPKSTSVSFEDVRSIEDFVIAVNDVVVDSAIPENVRTKYYELCCSQKSYLHIHLLKSLDPLLLSAGITSETVMMLSAGVISAVVDIADAIRASTITSPENFAIWEQSLKQFEKLGMNVGFLLDRLIQLRDLAQKLKRCSEAKSERIKAQENQQILDSRVLEVKEEINRLNAEVTALNPNDDNLELIFKEVANAVW